MGSILRVDGIGLTFARLSSVRFYWAGPNGTAAFFEDMKAIASYVRSSLPRVILKALDPQRQIVVSQN